MGSDRQTFGWKSILIPILIGAVSIHAATLEGELKKWHRVTLTFAGPATSETVEPNPFLFYRLNVTFRHVDSGKVYCVPGYYAADGNAAETGADAGDRWRVHFAPDEEGTWDYTVSFRKGAFVAVRSRDAAGDSAGFMDGEMGSFEIGPTDKISPDFRARGRLQYVGKHHLRFAETGAYFLKCGADAPENLLAYADFDGDFKNDGHKDDLVKTWQPHVRDWRPGDPTWQGGKGKGLIGALNYLASEGLNAFSFLTLNIAGDDQNVFPYLRYDDYERFDCSKLDQWEIVFEHATRLGLYLHFKTQEAENQGLLDGGGVGVQRRLYYRELIARFGHHLALNWNLGEENGDWVANPPTAPQDTPQRRAMAQYFHDRDPYGHLVVIHNGMAFDDLLGDRSFLTGASVQTDQADFSRVYAAVREWIDKSKAAGQPWVVACDEPGDAEHALLPDAEDPNHDNARKNALWGTLMAGGAGVEWYFGYQHAHSDLSCQDWRSRERMWDQCRYALTFFDRFAVPFWNMSAQNWCSSTGDWVLGGKSESDQWVFLVYLKQGGQTQLDLPPGCFSYGWFNPRLAQGLLQPGQRDGPGTLAITAPDEKDWVLLLRQRDNQGVHIKLQAITDFDTLAVDGFAPAYRDRQRGALAADTTNHKDEFAAAETTFRGPSGSYLVSLHTLTQTAGESNYRLIVDDEPMGIGTNPATAYNDRPVEHTWPGIDIPQGARLRVEFDAVSNGRVPLGADAAYAAGRWTQLEIAAPVGPRIFAAQDGLVVAEAEHFAEQSLTAQRRWVVMNADTSPAVTSDGGPTPITGASGGGYLACRSDTPLIPGEDVSAAPGHMAVLSYPIYVRTPGRYYVWVRAFVSGAEDQGLHVGLDGNWPESGQRMQWYEGKHTWRWESLQRTVANPHGEPGRIYLDIAIPGLHTIQFSLRTDGFEFDKWLMTRERDFVCPEGEGPAEFLYR